jgi:hypothetical protein
LWHFLKACMNFHVNIFSRALRLILKFTKSYKLVKSMRELCQQTGSGWATDLKSDPTVWDHMLMLYAKYQEAVISSCWENCYESFFPVSRPPTRLPPNIHHTITRVCTSATQPKINFAHKNFSKNVLTSSDFPPYITVAYKKAYVPIVIFFNWFSFPKNLNYIPAFLLPKLATSAISFPPK